MPVRRMRSEAKGPVVGKESVEVRQESRGPESIRFSVPGYPVTTNQAYRRRKGYGMYMTENAKQWKALIGVLGKRAMAGKAPLEGDIGVSLDLTFDTFRPDVDGPIKLVLDALQGIAYKNDRQVRAVSARKFKGEKPGTGIWVYSMEREP